MNRHEPMDIATMEAKAAEVAALLANLANARRLMVLCHLAGGEQSVNALTRLVGLSQSALSQHLARLRADGLVATRRSGATIHYRIANPLVLSLMHSLYEAFCAPKPQGAAP
jgi:ArsR family transcriptional regulator, virulence genes transcriptional regulator